MNQNRKILMNVFRGGAAKRWSAGGFVEIRDKIFSTRGEYLFRNLRNGRADFIAFQFSPAGDLAFSVFLSSSGIDDCEFAGVSIPRLAIKPQVCDRFAEVRPPIFSRDALKFRCLFRGLSFCLSGKSKRSHQKAVELDDCLDRNYFNIEHWFESGLDSGWIKSYQPNRGNPEKSYEKWPEKDRQKFFSELTREIGI